MKFIMLLTSTLLALSILLRLSLAYSVYLQPTGYISCDQRRRPTVHSSVSMWNRISFDSGAQKVQTNRLPAISNNRRMRQPFSLSNDASSEQIPVPTFDNNNSNKEYLSQSYRIAEYGYTIASILIFIIPDRTMTKLLATKWGGVAGFAISARLCRILRNANIENRLQSDTYKRLNIGLLGFNILGLFAIPGEAAFVPSLIFPRILVGILTTVRLFGSTVAWKGWTRNISTTTDVNTTTNLHIVLRDAFVDLWRGMQDTFNGLKVQSTKKALTYRNCLLFVCFGIISSFMEGLFNLRYQKEFTRTWFEITLQWSAMSRLLMISTMIYSLKDAAERDRLTGTTFIELNLLVGFWALFVGLGQAINPFGLDAYRGVEMYAFALPFLLKAYKSQREKSSAAKLKLKDDDN